MNLLKELRCFDDIFERTYFHPHKLFIWKIFPNCSFVILILRLWSEGLWFKWNVLFGGLQQLKTLLSLITLIAEPGQFACLAQGVTNGQVTAEAHRSPQLPSQNKTKMFFCFGCSWETGKGDGLESQGLIPVNSSLGFPWGLDASPWAPQPTWDWSRGQFTSPLRQIGRAYCSLKVPTSSLNPLSEPRDRIFFFFLKSDF